MEFKLLKEFESIFRGQAYLHRISTHGDYVAQFIYEDLVSLGHSTKLVSRINSAERVLNVANKAHGIKHRRGDGSFGTIIPGDKPIQDSGFVTQRGPIAHIEVGIEVKILAKAMIKQIDRVMNDLINQSTEFRKSEAQAVTIGIVGVNHASRYCSFEGERCFVTEGKKYKHPISEAADAISRIEKRVRSHYDEFLILRFSATNLDDYPFEWLDANATRQDYGSLLVRVSRLYDQRF